MLRQGVFESSSSSLPLCGCGSSRRSRHSTAAIPRKWLMIASVVLVLPWGLYTRTKSQFSFFSEHALELKESQVDMASQATAKRLLMEAFTSKKKHFVETNEALAKDLVKAGVLVDSHAENYEALEKREESMLARIDDLEAHIQNNSRFSVTEDYGKGPYKIELVVRSKLHMRIKRNTIIFELAPLSAMPHSVHHFLRMLSKRLWEGMAFMPQQGRIQASPIDMETLDNMDWKFENAKLQNLSFAEHSPDCKCGSYSIGFAGYPGGPDFYVSGLLDSKSHREVNDSCFGRIIEGQNVIDSIIEKKESPILGIESLRLLPNNKEEEEEEEEASTV